MGIYVAPQQQEMDNNGDPLSGGLLYYYEPTTTTPKAVYQDKEFVTPHTNPVVADSSGRWDPIYMDGEYKIVLKDANDVTIWTEDNITSGADNLFFNTVSISANTSIDNTYERKHIRATGTITLSLLDVATATQGFIFSVINDGTGLITIDPSSAEEINDTTTWKLAPGQSGICICDGSEWSFMGTGNGDGLNALIPIANAGGTVDAITATYDPPVTLTDRQMVALIASGANTVTNPTFAPDSLTLHTITKYGGTALSAEDIPAANAVMLLQYDLANTQWELLNPFTISSKAGSNIDMNAHQMQWSKGADVASATALPVLTDGNYFDVTGTTTVTSINTTGGEGTLIKLHFDAILTLTHNATDLILPSGANITTAAGDEAEFIEYATGDYRCTNYSRASGQQISPAGTVYAEDGAFQSLSAVIPLDNTIPQSSEGTEILSVAITPKNTNNKLRIRYGGIVVGASSGRGTFAVFTSASADAISARVSFWGASTQPSICCAEIEVTAGTTSELTISLRAGPPSGTMHLNGYSSGAIFGGVNKTFLVVEEILV